MGNEFVEIIEKVGLEVTKFKIGDCIFARNPVDNIGAFAQKIVINEKAGAKVPEYLSDQEAGCCSSNCINSDAGFSTFESKSWANFFHFWRIWKFWRNGKFL